MRQPADPVTLAPRVADLLRQAAQAPYRFDFFQLLRTLDALHPDKPRLGTARRPADEPVRLGQATDLAFAPAPLAEVQMHDERSGRPRIKVHFFGLFGPNGPLPLHLTAYARERRLNVKAQRADGKVVPDDTVERFADLFHHRLLLLFYRAWAQAQPAASLDRPQDDRFADYIGALIGTGGPEWRDRDAAPDHARLHAAGLLSRQVRNADGLAELLGGFLGMPVRVEQFVGRWMPLPEAERSRIGRRRASRRQSTAQLGASAVLGRAVFDRQHHIRLHIGPLRLAAFEDLLPPGRALPALQALVQHYLGLEFGWELRLELDKGELPPCRLGRGVGQGQDGASRLGWTTWLGRPPAGKPAVLDLVANRLHS